MFHLEMSIFNKSILFLGQFCVNAFDMQKHSNLFKVKKKQTEVYCKIKISLVDF